MTVFAVRLEYLWVFGRQSSLLGFDSSHAEGVRRMVGHARTVLSV